MPDITKLEYRGALIQSWDEMLSLTDMWRAAGSDPARQPSNWLAGAEATRFKEFLAETLSPGNSGSDGLVRSFVGGRDPHTRAHWQIGLAYAKYLSPEFHMWCNTVVRKHMEGRLVSPEELELTEEGMRRFGGMQRAIVSKLLRDLVPPILAEMKKSMLLDLRKDLAEIAGTDPAMVRQKGYKSMRELALKFGCRPGSKGVMPFGRMVSGASNMARAWCADARPDPVYPNGLCFKEQRTEGRPGIFMFHEIGISEWMKEFGIPRFREHNGAAVGQSVLQLVVDKKEV